MCEDRCEGEEQAGNAIDGERGSETFRPQAVKQPDRQHDTCHIGRDAPIGIGLGDGRLQGNEQHDRDREPDEHLLTRFTAAADHIPDGPEHGEEDNRADDAELRGEEFQPPPAADIAAEIVPVGDILRVAHRRIVVLEVPPEVRERDDRGGDDRDDEIAHRNTRRRNEQQRNRSAGHKEEHGIFRKKRQPDTDTHEKCASPTERRCVSSK